MRGSHTCSDYVRPCDHPTKKDPSLFPLVLYKFLYPDIASKVLIGNIFLRRPNLLHVKDDPQLNKEFRYLSSPRLLAYKITL